ncbi:MAG: ABC transporter permease [Eubacterium sp.]|nr:ABC transporter permease [Eubacterium sp.]
MIENIRLSFQGIFSHKLRSFLTMLGIIIGIASIIAIVSTIKGTNDEIKDSLVGAGDNVVNVNITQNGMEVTSDYDVDLSEVPIINDNMLENIKAIKTVQDAAIYHKRQMYEDITRLGNELAGCYLYGGDNSFINLMGYDLIRGRLFVDADFERHRNVTVLDSDTAYSLFDGEDCIDKTIEISGKPFVVVGIVEKAETVEPIINNVNDWYTYYGEANSGVVIIPDTSWTVINSFDQPYQVIIKATSTEDMADAGKKTQDYLNEYISSSGEEGSVKYTSEDIMKKARELQKLKNSTSKQLIWIASISLLVGGIGVMNIMLVSVTERTREIGLKKAIGARKSAILSQFLTEAAVLTSIGGLLGVAAGIGLAYFISRLAEVPVAISVPAIAVSVVFSMVIGIIFGLLPSIKAANLSPIEALRYE